MNGIVTGKVEKSGTVGWKQTTQFLANNIAAIEHTMQLADYGDAIVPNLSKNNFCIKTILFTTGRESYIYIQNLVQNYGISPYLTLDNGAGIYFNLDTSAKTLYMKTSGGMTISRVLNILAFGFLNV